MRILMVNKFLYPRAGAETYMLRLSESLIKAGHEIAFFGMDHKDKTTLGKTYTVKQVEFGKHLGKLEKFGQLFKAGWQNLKIKKIFAECCKDFKPDLIHAHNVYNQLPPDLFKFIEIPVVMTAHDYKPVCPSYNLFTNGQNCTECLNSNFLPCIKNKCVQGSTLASTISALSSTYHKIKKTYLDTIDVYVAPSRFMKDKLILGGIPSDKIKVINNFTDANSDRAPKGKKGFLYAGRICKEKGLNTLIQAYKQLPLPRPEMTICGTGPLKKAMQELSEAEGLNIHWTGYISPDKIVKKMDDAQAVIVPSIWNENCSMTIMESLANGRPVIASDTGGNPELITHGYDGLIFKSGDAEDLSLKLSQFLQLDLESISKNALETGSRFFSTEFHTDQILKLYQNALVTKYQNEKHHLPKPCLLQES